MIFQSMKGTYQNNKAIQKILEANILRRVCLDDDLFESFIHVEEVQDFFVQVIEVLHAVLLDDLEHFVFVLVSIGPGHFERVKHGIECV